MPSLQKVIDAIDMIDKQHLDIRTITMGISLLDCASEDVGRCCEKIYDKICHKAENLVQTGESIEREFGIPIVNKRISVTPMALVAGSCQTEDFVPFALTMDRAAKTCGVDFIGGFSALVQKGFTSGGVDDDDLKRRDLCGADGNRSGAVYAASESHSYAGKYSRRFGAVPENLRAGAAVRVLL